MDEQRTESQPSMPPEEFARRMRQLEDGCPEVSHGEADDLMCRLLRQLGYGEGVDVFEELEKWYS